VIQEGLFAVLTRRAVIGLFKIFDDRDWLEPIRALVRVANRLTQE